MLKNYFKIAWRNLWKHRVIALINVGGLTVGIAACLMILQYAGFELSYDRFHENSADIYRVVNDRYQDGKLTQHGTITYSAVGKALNDDYEEVVENTRVRPAKEKIIQYNGLKLAEEHALYADHSFLTLFSFPLLAGDASAALKEPYRAVLSETLARKVFGSRDRDFQELIGETFFLDRDPTPYKVAGISREVPANSHLQFNLLISYSTLYKGMGTGGDGKWKEAEHSFMASDFWHYIRLKPGADCKNLEAKLPAFSQRHFQGNKVSGSMERFYLQPLVQAHLYSDFENEIGVTGNATVVWGLLLIALLIILMAWINYMNLSAAASMGRAKEVGVRKTAGATGGQLTGHFLTESVLVTGIALLLAVLLVTILQGSYNSLVQRSLSFSDLFYRGTAGYRITLGFILLLLAGMLVSGVYPALRLLSVKPASVLKGKLSNSPKSGGFRRSLVVGQFVVAIALIAGSLGVYRQVKFMNERDLGFDIDQVLVVKPPLPTSWDSTYMRKVNTFAQDVEQLTAVKGATTSWRVPGNELNRDFNVRRKEDDGNRRLTMRIVGVSEGFTDLYRIRLLAGRNFRSSDFSMNWDDLHHIVLNQRAAAALGFSSPESAIGKKILIHDKQWDIIGIVADFHQQSLHHPIEPTLLVPEYNENSFVSVKVRPENVDATIATIREKYETFFSGNEFDYFFLDEQFHAQYRDDQLFAQVVGLFSGLAILIACLGLLGLSLFDSIRRRKEIGVRKVLGASVWGIVTLLSKDIIRLAAIAILIATPMAWYATNRWRENFAYRAEIEWWTFVLAGLAAVTIALLTVSFQSVKAALMNPVKSLRRE